MGFSHYDHQVTRRMDPNWNWKREHIQSVLPFYHNFGFTTTMIALMGGASKFTLLSRLAAVCSFSACVIIRKYEPRLFLRTIQDYKVSKRIRQISTMDV